MTDPKTLLRALFERAVAAADPMQSLAAHLPRDPGLQRLGREDGDVPRVALRIGRAAEAVGAPVGAVPAERDGGLEAAALGGGRAEGGGGEGERRRRALSLPEGVEQSGRRGGHGSGVPRKAPRR